MLTCRSTGACHLLYRAAWPTNTLCDALLYAAADIGCAHSHVSGIGREREHSQMAECVSNKLCAFSSRLSALSTGCMHSQMCSSIPDGMECYNKYGAASFTMSMQKKSCTAAASTMPCGIE